MNTPRGIRNNNPLNIRHAADRWQGASEIQHDKSFVQFERMAYGYRAAWKVLQTYYRHFCTKHEAFSVENIIQRWAPPSENDTGAYLRQVLLLTGLGGRERLLPPENPKGYRRLLSLLQAMTCVECGLSMQEVDTDALHEGYCLAFPKRIAELEQILEAQDEEGNSYI